MRLSDSLNETKRSIKCKSLKVNTRLQVLLQKHLKGDFEIRHARMLCMCLRSRYHATLHLVLQKYNMNTNKNLSSVKTRDLHVMFTTCPKTRTQTRAGSGCQC